MESTTTTFDFDNIINFRDVGETVNAFLAKRYHHPPLVTCCYPHSMQLCPDYYSIQ